MKDLVPITKFKNFITDWYADRNSIVELPQDEIEKLQDQHIFLTYGEVLPEGVATICDFIKPTAEDKFVDLGSGTGKISLQFFLCTPVQSSFGVEANVERWLHSVAIKRNLLHHKPEVFAGNRELIYLRNNLLSFDLNQVTIAFLASTCFGDELMRQLAAKINMVDSLRVVASLKEIPGLNNLSHRCTIQVATSWHHPQNKSPCFVYTKEIM